MAVADALLQFGPGLGETLRWSCYQPCELSGNIESIPLSWEMTGDDTAGVTLTITSGDVIPEIYDGEHWKENQVCYEAITKLDLGSVTEIGARAFTNLKNLLTITGPSVTTIGNYAFEGSTIFSPGDIGQLKTIGIGAFKDARLPVSCTFTGDMTFGDSAFEGSTVKEFDISTMTGTVGKALLKNCKSLTSFKGGKITDIPESFLEGCEKLPPTGFSMQAITENIGKRAFFGCASLAIFFTSAAVTKSIGESAFEGSGITNFDLTTRAEGFTLGANAFKDCKNLHTAICGSMPNVPAGLFDGCSSLRKIEMTTPMENIGARAFFGCSDISMTFGTVGATKSIGESAFEGTGIPAIDITAHADDFTLGANAFKDCKNLHTAICGSMPNVPAGLFDGCSSLRKIEMTTPMENIGARAFFGCRDISMTFGTVGVTKSIGESAFEGSGITSLDLKEHADDFTLGDSAFKDCDYLRTITWSPTLTTMPNSIFEGCGVFSVEIPATVTKFGEACFRNCKYLTTVTYLGHAEAPSSVFDGCDALKDVTVADDYPYDEFGGRKVDSGGLSLGAKIGIGVGVAAFVIIVIVVVVVVLFVTGTIGGGKRDAEAVAA